MSDYISRAQSRPQWIQDYRRQERSYRLDQPLNFAEITIVSIGAFIAISLLGVELAQSMSR